jgi:parvulin-like peptidyl-prolyl isomerase
MDMSKHIGRRLIPVIMCLGMASSFAPAWCSQAWADTGGQTPNDTPALSDQAATPEQENAIEAPVEEAGKEKKVYVLVNGTPIYVHQYNLELLNLLKNRYYHGKVPEGKATETRKELTDLMIDRVLLVQDAVQRGFKPDQARIARAVASEKEKNADNPIWQLNSERLVANISEIVGNKDLVEQVNKIVRNVPQPTSADVRAYYDRHLDLFTEPEKLHLSVILLKVDPSSPLEAWADAYTDALEIHHQIKEGADFAELARQRSGDKSAANGGDLGYLHRGMLPAALHGQLDNLHPGEVSEPIKGLQGFEVFRLEGRIPPGEMEFPLVEQRAMELLMREMRDQAVKDNIARLRNSAKIEIITPPIVAQ